MPYRLDRMSEGRDWRGTLADTLPVTFYRDALLRGRDDETPEILGQPIGWREVERHAPSRLSVAIRDKHYFMHYFHCIEILLGLFAYAREFLPAAAVADIHMGAQSWNNPGQNNVQRHLIEACFPGATVVQTPAVGQTLPARDILYVDRAQAVTALNKFLEPLLPLAEKWGPAFRTAVVGPFSVVERQPARRCAYVTRRPPRCLSGEAEAVLLGHLQRLHYQIEVVDFAAMSFAAQVSYCTGLDLLVGMHGNGLTNLLWLPDGAKVIEIFPPNMHAYDYQMFCEIRGLAYLGIDPEADRCYRDGMRIGPPGGRNDVGVARIGPTALAALDRFLAPR